VTEQVIERIDQLLASVKLLGVEVPRLLAEQNGAGFDDDDPNPQIEPLHGLNLTLRDDHAGFRVRFNTDIDVAIGRVGCDVLAEYELSEFLIDAGSTEAMAEFVNGVALMHVLPYTRQHIADVTQRVFGTPLLMPIVQRGEITFEIAYPAGADEA